MEPKVLSGVAPQNAARSRRLPWLPGIVLALVVLITLFALGGAASAQSGPESVLADPWATNFCYSGMQCIMGDFNGDGKDDIIQFNHTVAPKGAVYVRLSNGSSFDPPQPWHSFFCAETNEICKIGDFNADGLDDIITFVRGTSANVWVALSYGSGFGEATIWLSGFCAPNEICDVGDYNGDGKDDVSAFTRHLYCTSPSCSWGKVYVATADPVFQRFNKTANNTPWRQHFCASYQVTELCGSGDFNGDGKDDIVAFSKTYGQVWVALSTGSGFGDSAVWTPADKVFCWGQEICGVGDFNGDGKDDIITYLRSLYAGKVGWVYVALSNGSRFPIETLGLWNNLFCIGNQTCGSGNYIDNIGQTSYSQVSRTGDFNGDNPSRDDVVAFLRSTELNTKPGWVYVKLSYGGQFVDALPNFPPVVWMPLIMR